MKNIYTNETGVPRSGPTPACGFAHAPNVRTLRLHTNATTVLPRALVLLYSSSALARKKRLQESVVHEEQLV